MPRHQRSAWAAAAVLTPLLVGLLVAGCSQRESATGAPGPSASPSLSASPSPPALVIPESVTSFERLERMFDYDRSTPPDADYGERFDWSGTPVVPVEFGNAGLVAAGYLVVPSGEGPFPVVVFAPGGLQEVSDYFVDAAALSKSGYASLLLEEPELPLITFDAPTDVAITVQYVTQERRAIDLLGTLPQIDAHRIGFVGASRGAGIGAILAGVDDRIQAYVLAGVSRPEIWSQESRRMWTELGYDVPRGAALAQWADGVSVIDPLRYLRHSRNAAFLFLNGNDDFDSMRDAKVFLAAAPEPKTWHVYKGGHERTHAAANYLLAWMQKNL